MRNLLNPEDEITLLILELKRPLPNARTVTDLIATIISKGVAKGALVGALYAGLGFVSYKTILHIRNR